MKPLVGKFWHYRMIGFECNRLRCAVGWETLAGRCDWFKLVPATKEPWRGGVVWLWRLGLGLEYR
jgi:hypothetical protein